MATHKQYRAFGQENYYIMLAGIGLIALGLSLMAMETARHGFGFLGLTAGPVTIMLGFAVEFVAILYQAKPVEVEADAPAAPARPEPQAETTTPAPKSPPARQQAEASPKPPSDPAPAPRPKKKRRRK